MHLPLLLYSEDWGRREKSATNLPLYPTQQPRSAGLSQVWSSILSGHKRRLQTHGASLHSISKVRCVRFQTAGWHRGSSYWATSTEEQDLRWLLRNSRVLTLTGILSVRLCSGIKVGLFVIMELRLRVDTRRSGPNSKEHQSIQMLPKPKTTFAASILDKNDCC